MEKRLNLL